MRITTDPIGMQPTASIPFGHMADLELGSDVWSQAVVLGKLGTSILIYMDNTRVSFLDDLIKTCSWNILYFIPYTLMIKFTTCFPMVGGCLGTLVSSTTKTRRHDIAEIFLKVAWKNKNHFKIIKSSHLCSYPKPGYWLSTPWIIFPFFLFSFFVCL